MQLVQSRSATYRVVGLVGHTCCQLLQFLLGNNNLLSCHHIMQPLSRRNCAAAWCSTSRAVAAAAASGQPFGFQCGSRLLRYLRVAVVQVMYQDLAPHRLIIRGLEMSAATAVPPAAAGAAIVTEAPLSQLLNSARQHGYGNTIISRAA